MEALASDGFFSVARNSEIGQCDYGVAQGFEGGALSVYGGTGKLAKSKKLASKPFWKGAETFGKYGLQSTAYDFAYTEKKYFDRREWYEHVGIFAAGGLSGVGTESLFGAKAGRLNPSQRIALGAGAYAAEWSVTSLIKQRAYADVNNYPRGGFYTGNSSRAKGWLLLDKWRMRSRDLLRAQ